MKLKRTVEAGIAAALMFLIVISLFSGSTYAITGNYLEDGEDHPYVCLVTFYDENHDFLWRTTGSLLSSTVVLTAGHGTDGATYVTIWINEKIFYDPEAPDPDGYPNYGKGAADGTPYTHPEFGYYVNDNGLSGFIINDVGIVVLDKPVVLAHYGVLANVGTVDTLKVGTGVTFVGYGVQYQVKPKNNGGPYGSWMGLRQRFYATANLLSTHHAISSTFMKCSANAALGKGGTAFGDSGGPVLLGTTDIILATTSFGADANCAAVGYYARVDTQTVYNWITSFLQQL